MTVLIYHTNSRNFPVLFTQLQPQLATSDDIYVVGRHDALPIVKQYGSSRCFVFVEVGDYSKEEAIKFAFDNMKQNKQKGLLVIDERCVISQTFIANFKKAIKLFPESCLSPNTIHKMTSNFKWYNPSTKKSYIVLRNDKECYYLPIDKIKHYELFLNETVLVVQ